MIFVGKNITLPNDVLQPVGVEQLYNGIKNPDGQVAVLQKRLQYIKSIDAMQYRKLKTGLPYLVCAHFQPRIRRRENFIHTTRFLLDLDHLHDHNIDINSCRKKLIEDERVELLFTSPGGDGLKILFHLHDKISDAAYYSVFYKTFCHHFSQEHQLGAAVDSKTCDVSRCCFVSYDPDVYFNPNPAKVNCFDILPAESFNKLDLINEEIREREKVNDKIRNEAGMNREKTAALNDEVLTRIKSLVGTRVKKKEKIYVQPAELSEIMKQVSEQLDAAGILLLKSVPIDYGRQIRVGTGLCWAEINIFYGSKGITVVPTTKTGSNRELCETIAALLKNHFY